MDISIELEFELTKQDYSKATRAFFLHQPFTWISLGLFGILFLFGLFLAFNNSGSSPSRLLLLILFPLFLTMLLIYSPYQMGQRASKNERFTVQQNWQITEIEIKVTNQFSESKFDWGTFIGSIETKDFYLLRYSTNKNMFNILPKRAIENRQEEELKNLIMQKLQAR